MVWASEDRVRIMANMCLSFRCVEKYFELLGERKIKGYLFQEKNYFAGEGNKSA